MYICEYKSRILLTMGSNNSYMCGTLAQQQLDDYNEDKKNKNQYTLYTLYIYMTPELPEEVVKEYVNSSELHNLKVNSYLYYKYMDDDYSDQKQQNYFGSGFDLICPETISLNNMKQLILDYKIVCWMKCMDDDVNCYLYSRSSTPINTPIRLANNVCIIESGYRGTIKTIFDILPNDNNQQLNVKHKYVQICPPNIHHPMKVVVTQDSKYLNG